MGFQAYLMSDSPLRRTPRQRRIRERDDTVRPLTGGQQMRHQEPLEQQGLSA
jgi:hypothetical protein